MSFPFGSGLDFVECLVLLPRKHSTLCFPSSVAAVFGVPAVCWAL